MTFSFNQQDYKVTGEVPAELVRYAIPGSQMSAVADSHLKLLLQELSTPVATVYYAVDKMVQRSVLRIRDDSPLFLAYLALQQDRKLEIEGLGKMTVKEGQFNFVYAPHFDVVTHQDVHLENATLAIRYDIGTLKEWSRDFPVLANFLEKVEAGSPAALLPRNEWMTKEIQDTVYRVLHPPEDRPFYPQHFDLLVRTLLFHLLRQAVQQQPSSDYSLYEINGIQAARDIIRKNIRYHFVIPEIAQRVGMNEFKLKNGFRAMFGNGIYEYLRTERMQEARSLLHDSSRSIKEIANLTGYKSVNSFIKAFKKMYGLTPGDFRKTD